MEGREAKDGEDVEAEPEAEAGSETRLIRLVILTKKAIQKKGRKALEGK